MTPITLEAIKTEQSKLNEMIANFEAQAQLTSSFPTEVTFPTLNAGEKWVGVVITPDGKKREHIILLPGEKESINWKDSMEWAKSIGGELPDRVESALLFATMKGEFKPEWHWTREEHAALPDFAWMQTFANGSQSYDHEDYEYRARAIRRLKIL